MKNKVIKITQNQFNSLFKEITQNYFSKYEVFNYNNKNTFDFDKNKYIKVISSVDNFISEGIIKTYSTKVTFNHVYNMMKDYDIYIYVPKDDFQNEKETSNHIIVKTFVQTVNPNFENKLVQSFKTCGYALGYTKYQDDVLRYKLYQFEPMYQNTVNDKLWKYIYHVTTKNKMNSILKNGFTPKNANKLGFMYDGRCYFFYSTERVRDYLQRADKENITYKDGNLINTNEYVLFQIDTSNIKKNVKFYHDVNFESDVSIFCYANIPPTEINSYYLFSIE